ncbi:MAG: DUF5666 domain-containing protein [Woeseiaceae bacterium]|nr:DUF5666 domain-containing protein [Woeseiaceae bacterium]
MKTLKLITSTLLASALVACGGGGGGGVSTPPPDDNNPPTAGIGRTGIAMGPIANFGSIIVNGVRYDTGSATFTVNDSPGTQADLKVGQVVVVSGTIDNNGTTGTAQTVFFDDNVKGPVQSIDSASNQMVVMGQTVLISADTSFDDSISPPSLAGLAVDDIVEVSGLVNADGAIAATRIELKPAGTQFEVHGIVSLHDAANMRFNINALVVDYSGATLDNFPGGQISDGDPVEAKGMMLGGAGELVATQVELENPLAAGEDGDRIEIEGFITRFASATDFDVSGLPVTTNAATVYEGGDAGDLGLNIKVEVEGDLNASGVLVAEKVDIRRAKAVRATALLDSVDAANDSVVLLGITVRVDALTRIEDKSSADVDPLTVSDLSAGDYVEVRGDEFPAGSGEILATIFEREDTDPDTELQGFVESVSNPSLSILGVTIETNGGTVFRDANDNVISSAEFFGQLGVNDLVKATGTESADTVISASEVEFELEF